jgi:hypothetical protein
VAWSCAYALLADVMRGAADEPAFAPAHSTQNREPGKGRGERELWELRSE